MTELHSRDAFQNSYYRAHSHVALYYSSRLHSPALFKKILPKTSCIEQYQDLFAVTMKNMAILPFSLFLIILKHSYTSSKY